MGFFTNDTPQIPDDKKQLIDGILHVHYTALHKWEDNEKYRVTFEGGWERCKKTIKENGWKTKAQIDTAGAVYDGNTRFEATMHWINQGITTADNGKSLEWIPVEENPIPKNEIEALAIAAKGNGDKDFTAWNKDAVTNDKDKFDQIEGIGDLVFDTGEADTFEDTFDYLEEEPIEDEKPKKAKEPDCEKCKNYHERNHDE